MIFTKKAQDVTSATSTHSFNSTKDYLAARAIHIESTGTNDEKYNNATLAAFAEKLASLQLKGGDPFLKYIRTCIIKKDSRCNFSLKNLTVNEQEACVDIANMLCSIGALVNATESNGVIYGRFSLESPKLVNFLNGEFCEIAIYTVAKRILTEYARSKAVDYELLPNVITSSANGKREYDLLLRVGSEFYMLEVKSGRNEAFTYYRQRGIELGLYPDHQMIITSDRSDDEMSLISFFESLAIANYNTFREKLLLMINKQ